jgi:hypothetical protein
MPSVLKKTKTDDSIRIVNLKKLTDAGITIAAGTDAGNIGTQHASSFYDELRAMKESGLSNWQIIQSATINPPKIINRQDSLGSISVGKKADMILLNANPADDLEKITSIDLVINKGEIIHPDSLLLLTPSDIVDQQLNAYNQRNIDAFMQPYAKDIKFYEFPDILIGDNKEAMRKAYAVIFEKWPALHCEIKKRIIQGNVVIDNESVTGMGNQTINGTIIYTVENNKIKSVYIVN